MKKLRQEFADTLLEVAQLDRKIVVMVGDISHGILKPFAKMFPNRYYNIGICEPTMVNMAAGLSKVDLIPVVHTIAPFIVERSYEQIKLDFGYQKLPINIISVGGAYDYSQLGCSHHCYTDISLISHIENSNAFMPGSAIEFNELFKQTYNSSFINYFKLTENPHEFDFKREDIKSGKGIKVFDGNDITIATCGSMLRNTLIARDSLEKLGISVEVLYFHTLKPFDNDLIVESLSKTKKIISVEELSSQDGLYNNCLKASKDLDNVKSIQMAIEKFIRGYGTYDELTEEAGLNSDKIIYNAKKIIKK